MNIHLVSSVGRASRLISAFDKALQNAGVYNYNLLILSSVIPPGSKVIHVKSYNTPQKEYGYKLYCVRAEMRSEKKGQVIGAAMGYYQLPDGRGIFVEHERTGKSEEEVEILLRNDVKHSVTDLCKSRNFPVKPSDIKWKTSVAIVGDLPTCVLVLGVYQSEGWK